MKLKSENIVKYYGDKKVVKGVSLEVNKGEIVGLLGPNGAGKTTSFYMIVGLIKPNEGRVFLDGNDISSMPMYKRAQLGIGYLSQEASVFRRMTVEDNLLSVLEMTTLTKEQQLQKCEDLLNEFRLQKIRKNIGNLLSGGERRRTEIARCLASNPKIILMDEPFAGVDPIGINDIKELIKHLTDRNIGVLITDHQSREVLDTCEYSYIMHAGEIISEGTSDHIISDQDARKFYLGQSFKV